MLRRPFPFIVLLALAGCGARSGLTTAGIDRGDATAHDGGARDGGARDAGSDAPDASTSSCPPLSDFGYSVRTGVTLDLGLPAREISLGGDGVEVYLAVEADRGVAGVSLFRLEAAADRAVEVFAVEGARMPRLSVTDGTARLTVTTPGEEVVLVEARAGDAREVGRTTIFRGPLTTISRPAWNGVDVVVAGTNGFEIFVGRFEPGATSLAWLSHGPASDVESAARPALGRVEVLERTGSGSLRVVAFASDGSIEGPSEGVTLEEIGLVGRAAFGWIEEDDDFPQPMVLAGFASSPDGMRPTLRRFRADGSAAGGFSAPSAGVPGGVDLTTVAPRGHAHGYGMIAGTRDGGAIFHGAGEDFVGDSRAVPIPCDGEHLSIAAGPCGYVIACVADGRVQTAIAVPPPPR